MGKRRGNEWSPGCWQWGPPAGRGTRPSRPAPGTQVRPRAAPGVSATQINIGAISTLTGPLAGFFGGLSPGMIAYFKTVNAKGGINGRQARPDLQPGRRRVSLASSPRTSTPSSTRTTSSPSWRGLGLVHPELLRLDQDPDLRLQRERPTGRTPPTCSPWAVPPRSTASGYPQMPTSSRRSRPKSVAFISYGPAITSSYDACNTYAKGLKARPASTSTSSDVGAQLGGSYSSDVQRMQQAGSQLVVTCMQDIGQRHPGPGHPAVRAQDQAAVAQRLRPDPAQPVQQPHAGGLLQQHRNRALRGRPTPPSTGTPTRACRPTSRP